jgi:hypothetical protein
MSLPSTETVQTVLNSGSLIRKKILAIAKQLEALGEYSREQALRVATDIVRFKHRNLFQGES